MKFTKKYLLLVCGTIISTSANANPTLETQPSKNTIELNKKFAKDLPFDIDKEDFELVKRGFIATTSDKKLHDAEGNPTIDLDTNAFFNRPAPPSINPSLWRNAGLLSENGLFKVSDKIYQIRGFSISNITIITGDKGYIIIDPGSVDAARDGLKLVKQYLGDKPVTGVIYTHSHADHYGGILGIISAEEANARKIPIIAPKGFIKEVTSEWVIAGPAMIRRARYQFGIGIPYSETGNITAGIGPTSKPVESPNKKPIRLDVSGLPLIPTQEVEYTGQTIIIDGVKFEFQITPGTEATAELNFYLPDLRALCLAENANGTIHNILTPRGAQVRDTKAWADYLSDSISLYGKRTDVLFTSHFWPRWGQDKINEYLNYHRDAYKYLHDQSVRLMNDGYTAPEIAEKLELPPELGNKWYNRSYYGTLSHNSKAVYQRYLGWYDANPANLNALPPEVAAPKYVAALGGADKVFKLAKQSYDKGEYRWAAELLNKLIFAEPNNQQAKNLLADIYDQLGYQSESSNWRNIYLTGANELRLGAPQSVRLPAFVGLGSLPLDLLLDAASVRINPERTKGVNLTFTLIDPNTKIAHKVSVKNSVLLHEPTTAIETPIKPINITQKQFFNILSNGTSEGVSADDIAYIQTFAKLFDGPLANFNIVTP